MYRYGLTVESRELLYLKPREAPLARKTPYRFVYLLLPNNTPFTYVV